MNAQVIAVVNQKGGTGKSTTCANLGIGLAQAGKKVLVVDVDPQASLSISLGHSQPDDLPVTLSDLMGKVLNDQPIAPGEGILHHAEGVDLMPSNIQLSGMEVSLVNAMSRETILRQYLDTVRKQYTHILLDCQPCLIFSAFAASSPPVLDTSLSAVTMSWQYVAETIFNMLVLVALVKGAERIVKEMFLIRKSIKSYMPIPPGITATALAAASRKTTTPP